MLCELQLDLFCNWELLQPRYRLIVDSELHTERQYRWNNDQQYVCETVELELAPGQHTYEIVNLDRTAGEFTVVNARVNKKSVEAALKGTFEL